MGAINGECSLLTQGYWEYYLPDHPYPEVPKICSVFRTLGNRRLGDNVLTGLELFLFLFISDPTAKYLSFLPEGRVSSSEIVSSEMVALIGGFGGFVDGLEFFKCCDFDEPLDLEFPSGFSPKWKELWTNTARQLIALTSGGTMLNFFLFHAQMEKRF